MHHKTVALASFILMIAVLLGAFGAHGLEGLVDARSLSNWRTGVSYQFYHGFGLLFLALYREQLGLSKFKLIRTLFLLGIILFSGSLYLLSVRELSGLQFLTPVLGPVTPLGGVLLISAWATLLFTSLTKGKA